jgi:predicted CoA-binding protein
MEELIKEFMSKKKFAVIGATDNPEKYGNRIFKNLTKRGYEVYPVNPNLKEIEGAKCYPTISDVPVKVEVVDFVVPPKVTESVLKECQKLGLDNIWLQPGSESDAAIAFCNDNKFKVVYGTCVMLN